MSAGAPTVNVGDVIGGRYRVQSWIGQGHMAVVYQAIHEGTGKPCAIKLVHTHLVSRPDIVDLFLKEARVGGRIGHSPYIVDVFDAAVDEVRRVPFLAMELLQGEALDHYLHTRGPMPAAMVKVLYHQLGEALDQAHAAGVVHRDLKPANLFLTQSRKGEPVLKVVDFGIAKVLELEAQRTATQIGSPAYAAPEQLGQALRRLAAKSGITVAASVSGASDVWAMGLIAYELLTGLVAGQFWGAFDSLGDLVTRVVLEDPSPASVRAGDRARLLPPGFDAWLARCLAKDAALRWSSAGDAAGALVRLIDGESDAGRTVQLSPADLAAMGANPLPPQDTARLPREVIKAAVPDAPAEAQAGQAASPGAALSREVATSAPVDLSDPPLAPPALAPPTPADLAAPTPQDRSIGSVPPDTSAAGTKVKLPNERSGAFAFLLAALSILAVLAVALLVFFPKKGRLRIDVKAEGGAPLDRAEIFVDGQKICDTTPCVAHDLSAGVKTIKAVAEDGRMVGPIQEVVSSGEEKQISLTFAVAALSPPREAAPAAPPPPVASGAASAASTSPPQASTSPPAIEEPKSRAPAAPPSTSPPAGASTGASASGAPTNAPARDAERAATLNINSIPVSKIVFDGRPLGSTPKVGFTVTPGPHTVVFIHPQLGKKTRSVTVAEGETKTVAERF